MPFSAGVLGRYQANGSAQFRLTSKGDAAILSQIGRGLLVINGRSAGQLLCISLEAVVLLWRYERDARIGVRGLEVFKVFDAGLNGVHCHQQLVELRRRVPAWPNKSEVHNSLFFYHLGKIREEEL
ncbi:hypothetical protein J3D54_003453 [Pseudomonas sp. GGS8]|jgi:hypothetical protein|uniref:hypothetical protein n=1 Tax=Pseudomonas sp. GGS8 TaxID=2817892 RepID=UPI00209EA390|nr:hypothetical protein [Pseudomonas sp. GGS8]MCP1444321.1 hypothetical protein [Pseudomonas sp. GGS8]